MDGYRYWVERHRLLVTLEQEKEILVEKREAERPAIEARIESEFRARLDTLYADARVEFEKLS